MVSENNVPLDDDGLPPAPKNNGEKEEVQQVTGEVVEEVTDDTIEIPQNGPVASVMMKRSGEILEIAGLPIRSVPTDLRAGPHTTTGQVEILWRNGYSQDDIVNTKELAYNSVRFVVSTVRAKFGDQLPKEEREQQQRKSKNKNTALMSVDGRPQVPARGKPNELQGMIDSLQVPVGDLDVLKEGMKYGMSVVIMAVRIVQELSAIGVQQSKPLLDMAKSMREGEALAAKNSAMEAGLAAAQAVEGSIGPDLASLRTKVDALDRGSSANPMQNMFVRAMEPSIQKLMGSMFAGLPGMGGNQQQPPNQQPNTEQLPPVGGWPETEE